MISAQGVFRAFLFFVEMSISLEDLQGLARHTQSLNESTVPWPNFLSKGNLHSSGSLSH